VADKHARRHILRLHLARDIRIRVIVEIHSFTFIHRSNIICNFVEFVGFIYFILCPRANLNIQYDTKALLRIKEMSRYFGEASSALIFVQATSRTVLSAFGHYPANNTSLSPQ
jgi:hypothetical protein